MHEEPAQRPTWLSDVRAVLDAPMLWISVAVGVASGVSAVARLFDVGLVGLLRDFVDFYRALLSPFSSWLSSLPLPFSFSPLGIELLAIYAVLVGMGIRAESLQPRLTLDEHVEAVGNLDQLYKSVYGDKAAGKLGDTDELAVAFVNTAHSNWRGYLPFGAWVRCFLLLPILSLAPVTRYFHGVAASKKVGFEAAQYRFNQLLFLGFAAFISLPAALIIFFLINAYVPASQ